MELGLDMQAKLTITLQDIKGDSSKFRNSHLRTLNDNVSNRKLYLY